MNGQSPFRTCIADGLDVAGQLTQVMQAVSLQVIRSFNLPPDSPQLPEDVCPRHDHFPCDCQLIVPRNDASPLKPHAGRLQFGRQSGMDVRNDVAGGADESEHREMIQAVAGAVRKLPIFIYLGAFTE